MLGVARDIGRLMDGYRVIVNKSTVPVGTAEKVRAIIASETTHPFSVVSNPEFLKQGAAVDDFMKPDRVVIGAEDPRGAELMVALYQPFTRTGAPVMVMDCASAELSKYAANALLATRISFMNEVANVCELFGADVDRVRQAVGSDRRIGPSFLFPGRRLRRQLLSEGREGADALLGRPQVRLQGAQGGRGGERVAEARCWCKKMEKHFGSLKGRTIAIWGLAFKPKTDDMREAPAIPIVKALLEKGAKVQVYDPEAHGGGARASSARRSPTRKESYDALRGADALAIVTEWQEFREPDFARMRKLMKSPVIFDGRNIYQPQQMKAARLHLQLDRTVTRDAGPRHRRGGLHRQPRGPRPARRRARGRRARRSVGRPRRGRAGRRAARARARPRSRRRSPTRCASIAIDAVMHFAAWLSVADRCAIRSATTRTTSSARCRCWARWSTPASRQLVFSSTCAVYGEPATVPIDETLETQPINAYGETKLAVERALPHLERAHGLRWIALRYFNAAGAHPDGTIGEDHDPEIHLIPRAIEAATRRAAAAGVRRGLSDAGRHLPARLHPRLRSGRRRTCCALAGARSGRRALVAFNVGHRTPHSVKQVIDTVEPRGRARRCAGRRRRAVPAIRRRSTPRAIACSASWAGSRDIAELDTIVRHAWQLASDPSAGLSNAADDLMEPLFRLLRYAAPHRLLIAGATLAMLVYGAASAAQAWLIKPIIDEVLPSQRVAAVRRRSASSSSYFFKGIGGYFSSYLMDDLGHRVVMALRNELFRHLLDQSAAFFSRRIDRPAAVAHQQRRRAGAARRRGNGRRSRARIARR